MTIHDLQVAKLYLRAEAPLLLPHFTGCLIDSPCSSRQWSSAHHQLASDLQAIRSIRWLPRWITQDAMGRSCVSPWRVSWCWWHCDPISAGTSGVNPLYKQLQKGALGLSSGIGGRLYVLVSNTLELKKNWTDTVLYWSLWEFLIANGITPNII